MDCTDNVSRHYISRCKKQASRYLQHCQLTPVLSASRQAMLRYQDVQGNHGIKSSEGVYRIISTICNVQAGSEEVRVL